MTNTNVKVIAHPESGLVITPSTKNPEWGTFRVDSENVSMEGGILNIQKRSAFVRGKLDQLGSLGLRAGQTLAGKIIKKESFEPFYVAGVNGATSTQEPKINPTTKEVVLTNGKETFLEFEFTADMTKVDTWVGADTTAVSAEVEGAIAGQTV